MRASRLAKRLPVAINALRHEMVMEESSDLLPLKGTLLISFCGMTGKITDILFGREIHVQWDNGTQRVYTGRFGAII